MSNLEIKLQEAFDLAKEHYHADSVEGSQVLNHIQRAMSIVDVDAAQLLNGQMANTTATMVKLKPFPVEKLQKLQEPAFTSVSANALVAETDNDFGADDDELNEKPFDVETFVSLAPKDAVERFGVETIERMIYNLAIEIKDGATANQKAAALRTFLTAKK